MPFVGPAAQMYGDPANHDVEAALAAHHGVSPDDVVVGAGIDGLVPLLEHPLVVRAARVG